jgi:hypothetical protein
VWVGAKLERHFLKTFLKFGPGFGAAHGPFHTQTQGNLFELFAMFVLTVVYGMNQLMHQYVQDRDRVIHSGRNEHLVAFIGAALTRPALTNMDFVTGTGKSTGHRHLFRYVVPPG